MATSTAASRPQDRTSRRRPFAWMKRLTNLKSSSGDSNGQSAKKNNGESPSKSKKTTTHNVSFPAAGYANGGVVTNQRDQHLNGPGETEYYAHDAEDPHGPLESCNKSTAPTVATNPETIHSDTGQSKAGTSNTVGGRLSSNDGGENSIFSSPNHSSRSLTTTLTTIQSTAPSQLLNHGATTAGSTPQTTTFSHHYQPSQASTHASPPPSAIPHHLIPPGTTSASASYQPSTYASATANNILTDNASVLTLASSSKRHNRRDSVDTGASVRALAPSSAWGGSRESLPLSVLSGVGTIDSSAPPTSSGPGPGSGGSPFYQTQQRPSYGGSTTDPQRTSYYSTTGTSAYNPQKERFADGSSVRSGLLSHSRNESGGGVVITSPLPTSPREPATASSSAAAAVASPAMAATPPPAPSPTTAGPMSSPPYGRSASRRSTEWVPTESLAEKEQREDEELDRQAENGAPGPHVPAEHEPLADEAMDSAAGAGMGMGMGMGVGGDPAVRILP